MGDQTPRSTLLINAGAVALVAIAILLLLDPFGSDPKAIPAGGAPAATAQQTGSETPSGGSSSVQEDLISQTVTTFVTRSVPADCKFTYTQRFVDRAFDGSGGEAIARCQYSAVDDDDRQDGDQAVIEQVSIESGRATVVTGTNGGLFDGTVHTLRLVRDAGTWKVDSVSAVKVDRERWDRASYNAWIENGFSAEEAECVLREQSRTADTGALERALLAGYQGREIEGPEVKVEDCISAATLERKFSKKVWKSAAPGGIAPSVVDCITSSMLKSMSSAELRRFIFLCEWPGPEVMNRALLGCLRPRA
jgi:hypothetical protein